MTTTLTTKEGNTAISFSVDHCSLEVVGIHAAKRGTRFEALEPIHQDVRHSFGVAQGRTLRHDHGSQFVADDFQNGIKLLGIKIPRHTFWSRSETGSPNTLAVFSRKIFSGFAASIRSRNFGWRSGLQGNLQPAVAHRPAWLSFAGAGQGAAEG